ncbi:MAG: hypothetical protein AB8B97_01895 [Granulosicoccus sp.]
MGIRGAFLTLGWSFGGSLIGSVAFHTGKLPRRRQIQAIGLGLSPVFFLVACSGGFDSGSSQVRNDAPIVDPAPEFFEPGEYRCDGCPEVDVAQFRISTEDSIQTFRDTVSNAVGNGEVYVLSDSGSTNSGPIATAENGQFSFTTPLFCGRQIVKCVWSNEAGSYVLITEVSRTDCTDSDIQVTLTWDDLGDDFDLHLVRPGGEFKDRESDCYYATCRGASSPDWGVVGDLTDNPSLDVDNTDVFGPENIFLTTVAYFPLSGRLQSS